MIAWVLDAVPWWVYAIAIALILASTFSLWRPLWLFLPLSAKAVLFAVGAGVLAYLAGRNQGASGAVQRERQRNDRLAKDLVERANNARTRQRAADAGGVRDGASDPFRRD